MKSYYILVILKLLFLAIYIFLSIHLPKHNFFNNGNCFFSHYKTVVLAKKSEDMQNIIRKKRKNHNSTPSNYYYYHLSIYTSQLFPNVCVCLYVKHIGIIYITFHSCRSLITLSHPPSSHRFLNIMRAETVPVPFTREFLVPCTVPST